MPEVSQVPGLGDSSDGFSLEDGLEGFVGTQTGSLGFPGHRIPVSSLP